jgi:metallo-beta-lactamase class B
VSRLTFAVLAAALLPALSLPDGSAAQPENQPSEPFRIADHVYYVGSSDLASYLITTPDGHVLIDGGDAATVPIVQANIARLGFRVQDVKILLNTQAHFDHAGGLADLKRLTGASLMASDADAAAIERGGRQDFNFGDARPFAPVTVDRRLKDGDIVRLGDVALTAHVTPGHTKGCTTWTFDARDRGRTYHVVDLCGLSILEGTRVSGMPGYPEIATDYARTFDLLTRLPCDIFLGAHASYYGGQQKAQTQRARPRGPNPFVDPQGYRRFVAAAEEQFRTRLARERGE